MVDTIDEAIDLALDALAAKACHYGDCQRHDCIKVQKALAALLTFKADHVIIPKKDLPIHPANNPDNFGLMSAGLSDLIVKQIPDWEKTVAALVAEQLEG